MPQICTVVFDNALNSQNQDYLPSRYILQKEVIDSLITQTLENDPQSLIGLIPIAQKDNNDILTPTMIHPHLTTFLHKRDLYHSPDWVLALFQADKSLHIGEISEKIMYIILASPVDNCDELLANIYQLVSKGVIVQMVCFADARSFGQQLAADESFPNLNVLLVDPEEDFNNKVARFFSKTRNQSFVDTDLEEAIRRSMYEK